MSRGQPGDRIEEALAEIERLRSAVEAIEQATIEGWVCDDVRGSTPSPRCTTSANKRFCRARAIHGPHRRRAQFLIAGALPGAHHTIHHHQQATD